MPKQPGRPRLPKGERVADRERLTMYVTKKEGVAIRVSATLQDMSVSKYLRSRVIPGWLDAATQGTYTNYEEKRDAFLKYVEEQYGEKFSEKDS